MIQVIICYKLYYDMIMYVIELGCVMNVMLYKLRQYLRSMPMKHKKVMYVDYERDDDKYYVCMSYWNAISRKEWSMTCITSTCHPLRYH